VSKRGFALVIQGGGTRAAFCCGVLEKLMEKNVWADYVIGTSAGALLGSNYVSRDLGRSKRILLEVMSGRHFASARNLFTKGGLFDFDYLFNRVPRDGISFNEREFKDSPMKFYCSVSGCLDGEAHYFEKSENCFWDALAASSSMPIISKPVMVKGKPYLDGGTLVNVPYEKAMADGYEKVVVILSRHHGFRKEAVSFSRFSLAKAMYREYPRWLCAYEKSPEIYNEQMERLESLSDFGRVYLIAPSAPITIGHAEKNAGKLMALIEEGEASAEASLPGLEKYLSMNSH
jgi:predicted patatin/cPLA2 family phospholipase